MKPCALWRPRSSTPSGEGARRRPPSRPAAPVASARSRARISAPRSTQPAEDEPDVRGRRRMERRRRLGDVPRSPWPSQGVVEDLSLPPSPEGWTRFGSIQGRTRGNGPASVPSGGSIDCQRIRAVPRGRRRSAASTPRATAESGDPRGRPWPCAGLLSASSRSLWTDKRDVNSIICM